MAEDTVIEAAPKLAVKPIGTPSSFRTQAYQLI